jgi:two-component system, cell cycle response regulator DivK
VGSSPGRVVLLVEDDRDGRQLFAAWLEQAGYQVVEAHNGLQALERAFDVRPDVVVTDLNIPGIDGYELTRRLKSDPRTGDIPILAVTGYVPFAKDPSRADRAGCDATLSKPCSLDELENTVRMLIEDARRPRSA